MTIITKREIVEGIFIERKSRFSATVIIDGMDRNVYVPNSGRMKELFIPGTKVLLSVNDEEHRKTKFDLLLVEYKGQLVSVDSRMPNEIIYNSLLACELPQFAGYTQVKREARYNESRLDFRLQGEDNTCFIEVKSVTLVKNGMARFPDAPTPRGSRHLRELARAVNEGHRGAAIFVIQRKDANSFSPNDDTDPEFGATLRKVITQGVEVYAYICGVQRENISLLKQVNVVL